MRALPLDQRRARPRRARDRGAARGPDPAAHAPAQLRLLLQPGELLLLLRRGGERVETIVAEITNTPWGERHAYVLPAPARPGGRACASASARRSTFAVHADGRSTTTGASPRRASGSPCTWRTARDGAQRVRRHARARRAARSSGASLAAALLRYPFASLRVLAAIYWQALRLWLEARALPRPPRNRPSGTSPHERHHPDRTDRAARPRMPTRSAPSRAGSCFARLRGPLRAGLLRVREGERRTSTFGAERTGTPMLHVTVHDPRFYAELAFGGSVGAAESYMLGHWERGRPHGAAAT